MPLKVKLLIENELKVLNKYGFLVSPEPQNPTERTIRHVNKFSKTLKRRLTQRTLYEARELKKQGVNVMHVVVQLVDLVGR